MKKMRKVLAALLCVAMVAGGLPDAAEQKHQRKKQS